MNKYDCFWFCGVFKLGMAVGMYFTNFFPSLQFGVSFQRAMWLSRKKEHVYQTRIGDCSRIKKQNNVMYCGNKKLACCMWIQYAWFEFDDVGRHAINALFISYIMVYYTDMMYISTVYISSEIAVMYQVLED